MSRYTRLPRKGAAQPSSRRRWKAALAIIFAVVIVFAAAVVGAFLLLRSDGGPSSPKAAIVDQLSLNEPNPEFVQAVTGTLQDAGYTVDYFSGEYATVDLFRILPERGYDLLILRVHSARVKESREGALTEEVALFSGEPYDENKYQQEQWSYRLDVARYHNAQGEETLVFGIGPDFIRDSMKGRFPGTTVIMMGCDGLSSDTAAAAFVEKGASAVVSWSGPVSAAHTDAATESLVRRLVVDGLDAQEAVAQTAGELGPDPSYGSTLLVYP